MNVNDLFPNCVNFMVLGENRDKKAKEE